MLHCYSVSHQNTPLSVREKIDFHDDQLSPWLRQSPEAVVLSTCNRVEMYTTADDAHSLWVSLMACHGVNVHDIAPYTVRLNNFEAANHLFSVACSLRSMALGEAQILGQVTHAFELAQAEGDMGHQLSMLFRAAIHSAKRVHTETAIDVGNVSVSSLGIAKMEAELGSLDDKSILVIGAGEMGQAVVKGLDRRQLSNVQLVSRTFETAKQIAMAWGITACPITQLKDLLAKVDVVFTTSSAPFPILSAEDITPIMALRDGRDLYMVDIAVPRDIAPEVATLDGVYVFNVDDLQQVVDGNLRHREAAIPHAHQIIEEELTKFWQELESLSVVPTICQIREQANLIRQSELDRIRSKLPPEAQDDLICLLEEFSHRFMNKILHQPTHNLRTHAGQGTLVTSVARTLFGLEES